MEVEFQPKEEKNWLSKIISLDFFLTFQISYLAFKNNSELYVGLKK